MLKDWFCALKVAVFVDAMIVFRWAVLFDAMIVFRWAVSHGRGPAATVQQQGLGTVEMGSGVSRTGRNGPRDDVLVAGLQV